jgi:20S proteasome alpha/beta subunit
MYNPLDSEGFREVTVGIGIACQDGIVIGADRKVTMSRGTRIKSLEDKISKLSFRDGKKLLVCGAGSTDHARRAIEAIDPNSYDSVSISVYRDMVETTVSRLTARLASIGLIYEAILLFGMIDADNKPVIGHIMSSGFTETKYQGYFTAGIAAPYAELVLKDSYSPEMGIEDARLIVAGLIEKIGKVDNDVEGMDVFSILVTDKQIKQLTFAERQAVSAEGSFSFDFKRNLDALKGKVNYWNELLDKYRQKTEKSPEGKSENNQ